SRGGLRSGTGRRTHSHSEPPRRCSGAVGRGDRQGAQQGSGRPLSLGGSDGRGLAPIRETKVNSGFRKRSWPYFLGGAGAFDSSAGRFGVGAPGVGIAVRSGSTIIFARSC